MYKLLNFDGEKGEFSEISTFNAFDDAKNALFVEKERQTSKVILYFDNSDCDLDEESESEIFQRIIDVNMGDVTMITKGALITKIPAEGERVCCGSGSNCFCVVANGVRECQTQYCNTNGVCVWVRCNIPCGC